MKPLAIDLFCGLGGWTEGLLAEGYRVVGFDNERHQYGDHRYPAQLVIQDVLTLHGSQFKSAALIVASPPCQEYSYMSQPWTRARKKADAIRADVTGTEIERLNRLFDACFRIQREACEAAGHHIPLIVENVCGAQEWVGRARWRYGSFFLWGDVPALMPITFKARKVPGISWSGSDKPGYVAKGFNTTAAQHIRNGATHTRHLTNADEHSGIKQGGRWFTKYDPKAHGVRSFSSKSIGRKRASAIIAKIPLPLSLHIARIFYPRPGYPRLELADCLKENHR